MSITIEKARPIVYWGKTIGKPTVVLISGKAGVGKTTFATLLYEELINNGFKVDISSFAKGVKNVAIKMGWDRVKDSRGRKLLQDIGNVGRTYDLDMWVDYLFNNLDVYSLEFLLIDDWRFPNEYLKIKSNPFLNVFTVRIIAPNRESLKGTKEYNDISEIALDFTFSNACFTEVIDNTGDIDILRRNATAFLNTIFGKELFT